MHSPPRKVNIEEQEAWKVPPAITTWKNLKGYTVPLDKRLPLVAPVGDPNLLERQKINDKFAQLSESLFRAERSAREEIVAHRTRNLTPSEQTKMALAAQARRGDDDGNAPAPFAPAKLDDDKFARLSKSLFIAERNAREEIEALRIVANVKQADEQKDVAVKAQASTSSTANAATTSTAPASTATTSPTPTLIVTNASTTPPGGLAL
jgi:hypothetical protein